MRKDLKEALSNFNLIGKLKSISPYGEGHINETYLVRTTNKDYILQKMNTNVFPNHENLMENILNVTTYLTKKNIETLKLNYTKDNHHYLIRDYGCFRLYDFIVNSITFQSAPSDKVFELSGFSFGEFQNHLADFDTSKLKEVIKDFHNTPVRYKNFLNALKENPKNRAKEIEKETKFIKDRANTYNIITDLLKENKIPTRVTHNDTKLNNILFDANTNLPRAVIDLDTIMPGSLLYDFGDSIRFGANTAKEDEKDLNKISISLPLFKSYSKGYLKALKKTITKKELELLPYSAYLLTIECGIRFLTDYLLGDVYFNIKYNNHNLVRARNQLKLASDIQKNKLKLKTIINGLYNE